MLNHIQVEREFNHFTELKRRLLSDFPDLDDDVLWDTLDGASNLKESIAELTRSSLIDDAYAAGLQLRIDEMKHRLTRLQQTSRRKRDLVLEFLEKAGVDKIVQPDLTISLRTTPGGVEVIDETKIPDAFWIPQPSKLNKAMLADVLRGGATVTGASLANSRISLSVRRK
jgi:hypothetical protein